MKTTLIFKLKRSLFTKKNIEVEIRMDVYRVEESEGQKFPEGYRFSWIAFDRYDPQSKVLFDCHPPKGPHFHINEAIEEGFEWQGLEDAMELFWQKVWGHFGERDDGGEE